jgi:hypothetical protein
MMGQALPHKPGQLFPDVDIYHEMSNTCITIQLVHLNKVHTFLICKPTCIKGNLTVTTFS